jgi:general secretion pathway protein A
LSGYIKHFGLTLMPFSTAPDPRFAYGTRAHEIALLRMQDSVEQRLGLCLLKGEIGTGKSTIAHLLLQTWAAEPDRFTVAYLSDPSAYTQAQFLRLVVSSFGLEASRYAEQNKSLLRALLLDQYEAGKTVVLLIDEAQTISAPNMATLQQFSNEQTSNTKLIQIALLAQPNFDRKLSYQPALNSRIARRGNLDPLIFSDAIDMMRYRVTVAEGDFDTLFPVPLHRPIYNATQGIPRRICILCDNILLNAYARGLSAADEDAVAQSVHDCGFGDSK